MLPPSLGEINLAVDYLNKVDKMLSPINLTSNFTKQSKEDMACSGMKCSSWDVLHPSFYVYCTAPPPYPTTYDKPMALLGHQLDVVLLLNKEA